MLITALLMGLAGSLHCAGMCSPLLMAVTNRSASAMKARVIYNAGRILTYGMLGLVVSTIGTFLSWSVIQNGLSILAGTMLIIFAISGAGHFQIPVLSKLVRSFTTFVKDRFVFILDRNNPASLFLMGALNGLLPCGMTLIALSSCLILPRPVDGFEFMLAFGAGTLPVMLGFASVLFFAIKKFHLDLGRITTGLMVISGMILIARVFFQHGMDAMNIYSDIVICR